MIDQVFVGELELVRSFRSKDFQRFESLPLAQEVQKLASEVFGTIEIMPYQRQGETLKLALSVYLRPKFRRGRIIVILLKERYPRNFKELVALAEKAKTRLKKLVESSGFDRESRQAAKRNLDRLLSFVYEMDENSKQVRA
jgi:hypothetical protein